MTRVLSGFPAEFINGCESMGLLIHKSTLVLAILNGPVSSASYFLDLILLCFMLLKMEISMPLTSLLIPRRSLTFYPIKDAAKTRGIFFFF